MVSIYWLLLVRISLVALLERTPTSPEPGAVESLTDIEAGAKREPVRHRKLVRY